MFFWQASNEGKEANVCKQIISNLPEFSVPFRSRIRKCGLKKSVNPKMADKLTEKAAGCGAEKDAKADSGASPESIISQQQ